MIRCILLYLCISLLAACSGGENSNHEISSQAAQAARAVADTDHTDTLALQRAIVDARVQADKFLLTGNPDAAEQFEQAFADSLKVYDPQLANEIFPPEK